MDAQWMVDVAVVALETNNMACPSGPIRAMWEKSGYLVNRILDTYMNKIPSRILDVALRGIQQVYRLAGYR
jgi:hypothetical protein